MSIRGTTLRLVTEGMHPGGGGQNATIRRRRCSDWAAPLAFANAHFVSPAFYVGLRESGGLGDLPDEVCAYLALLYEGNRDRNGTIRRQVLELAGALCDVGVKPLLLKGALALFLGHYQDPGARMIGDVDILVQERAADRVFCVLRDLGYRAATLYPSGHHAYADFMRSNDPGAVDLHFELIDARYILPAEEIWRRARDLRVGNLELCVPSPTDCVLHNLLHAQTHYLGNFYRGVIELRQLHDFATLARHFAGEVDWTFIADRMARHRLDVPLQSYMLAAERLFALDWCLPGPPSARARLHYRRCMTQLHSRVLEWIGVPWGNVRASFAWHRMNALYGRNGHSPVSWMEHALQYGRKKNARAAVARLFRVQ